MAGEMGLKKVVGTGRVGLGGGMGVGIIIDGGVNRIGGHKGGGGGGIG